MQKQGFDFQTSSDEVVSGVNLSGRVAVVTGASSGLGLETAKQLAVAKAKVVLIARSQQGLDKAIEEVKLAVPDAQLDSFTLDLADFDSVNAAAKAIADSYSELHLLINNAGLMACPLSRNADGYEMQFAANYLGHFLFTEKLMHLLLLGAKQQGAVRVINLSSGGHKIADIDFSDPNFEQREYDKWQAYGQAKTACGLLSTLLVQRYADQGLQSFAVHPGMIATNLGRHLTEDDYKEMMEEIKASGSSPFYKSIPQGAATSLWAATNAELDDKNGEYLENCQLAKKVTDPSLDKAKAEEGYMDYVVCTESAQRLLELSQSLLTKYL